LVKLIQCQLVVRDDLPQTFGTEHLNNLYQLVLVVAAFEEWFFLENHRSQYRARAPDI